MSDVASPLVKGPFRENVAFRRLWVREADSPESSRKVMHLLCEAPEFLVLGRVCPVVRK